MCCVRPLGSMASHGPLQALLTCHTVVGDGGPPHGEGTHPPLKEAVKWGLSQSDVKATLLGILGESAA